MLRPAVTGPGGDARVPHGPVKVYRTQIEDHVIELRIGDLGGREVLLDGRMIQRDPWAGWRNRPHRFDLTGRDGVTRHIELRRVDLSKLGLGRYRMIVSVDGVERCRLEHFDESRPPNVCANCGYSLSGLKAEGDEVRCPECGRHALAEFL